MGGHRHCIPNKGTERTKSRREEAAEDVRKSPSVCYQKAKSKGKVVRNEDGEVTRGSEKKAVI